MYQNLHYHVHIINFVQKLAFLFFRHFSFLTHFSDIFSLFRVELRCCTLTKVNCIVQSISLVSASWYKQTMQVRSFIINQSTPISAHIAMHVSRATVVYWCIYALYKLLQCVIVTKIQLQLSFKTQIYQENPCNYKYVICNSDSVASIHRIAITKKIYELVSQL